MLKKRRTPLEQHADRPVAVLPQPAPSPREAASAQDTVDEAFYLALTRSLEPLSLLMNVSKEWFRLGWEARGEQGIPTTAPRADGAAPPTCASCGLPTLPDRLGPARRRAAGWSATDKGARRARSHQRRHVSK
jgi:hypothetical protein